MKKTFRILFGLVFILICAAYGAYYYTRPVEVETIELQKKDLYDTIDVTGTVVSNKETEVASKVFGQVLAVYHENGDRIKKGELLLKLDGTDIGFQEGILKNQLNGTTEQKRASVDDLKGKISIQKETLKQLDREIENKKKDLDTNTYLFSIGELSQTELDVFQQAYDRALNAKNQGELTLKAYEVSYQDASSAYGAAGAIRAQLAQLTEQKKQTKVYANSTGILTGFQVKKGGIVTNQTSFGRIIDPGKYKIEAYVLTDDAYNLKAGDLVKVVIKLNGKDQESGGKITEVGDIAENWISPLGLSEKRVKITVAPEKTVMALRVGSEVKVKFVTEFKLGTLAVPKTSIFYREDEKRVLIDENGVAKEAVLTTGMDSDTEYAVENGLNAGMKLIKNYKIDGLKAGKKVIEKNQ